MINFFKALYTPPSSNWQAQSLKQYGDLWMMGWSSMQTVFYRSLMIRDACEGRIDFAHPEFSRMSQEKLEAAMEGTLASTHALQRFLLHSLSNPALTPAIAINRMMDASVDLLDVSMKPVQKKANANAQRLRKEAGKNSARKTAKKS